MTNTKTVDFISKQIETCKEAFKNYEHFNIFMSKDGICRSCDRYIIDEEIKRGNDGSKMVTGCPLCSRSYCD